MDALRQLASRVEPAKFPLVFIRATCEMRVKTLHVRIFRDKNFIVRLMKKRAAVSPFAPFSWRRNVSLTYLANNK